MPYTLIQKYDPSDVEVFRSLRGKGGLFEKGLFIAESEKIARKVLESAFQVPLVYMTEPYFERLKPLFDLRLTHTNIFLAPKAEMEAIVGYHLHQGLMLACRVPRNPELLAAMNDWHFPWMAIALDAIADAENMGAIIRNAAAFGASAVIVDEQSCNPYLRRSVRVSMGTIVDVEIIIVEDLSASLQALRHISPMRLIGASLSENSIDLAKLEATENTILIFGSEGWGLRESVTQQCDILARIPMADGIDSLNVAIASGIFMHWLGK